MTPYLLALGLWALGWAAYGWWAWREIDCRHDRALKDLANQFPKTWER